MSQDFYCSKCFKLVAIIEKGSKIKPGTSMTCYSCSPKKEKPKGPLNETFGNNDIMGIFDDIFKEKI